MQTQMTERDKKLIVFLAIFVILVAGGYWGIYPAVSEIISLNMEIRDAQADRDMNEIKIAQAPLLETDNERLQEDMANLKEEFFPVMTNDQVDKYMTGLILDYQLYAYDLSIRTSEEEAEVEPYQYSEKAAEEEEESVHEDVSTGIYAVEVTVRVGGDRADLQQLIDDLSVTERRLHLSSYSWDDERSISYHEDGTYEVNTEHTLTMTINLYMCEEQEWK